MARPKKITVPETGAPVPTPVVVDPAVPIFVEPAPVMTIAEAKKDMTPTYPRVIKRWTTNGFPMERVEYAEGLFEDKKLSTVPHN